MGNAKEGMMTKRMTKEEQKMNHKIVGILRKP